MFSPGSRAPTVSFNHQPYESGLRVSRLRLLEQIEAAAASVAMNTSIVEKLNWIDKTNLNNLKYEAEITGKMLSSLVKAVKKP